MDFFEKLVVPEEDEGMTMLKNNIGTANIMFINAIAFNFSFITEISEEQRGKLREMIGDTIAEFRKTENV